MPRVIKRSETPDPMPELRMLPVFYLFPQELLDVSEFADFPRNPYAVRESEYWMSQYNSLKFKETMADGLANMVWRHFGIKAGMETFSGYYPFWILARIGWWLDVAAGYGFNTYSMATASRTFQYPVLSAAVADSIFAQFVAKLRSEFPLDEWIKAVQEMPAHEDYEPSCQSRGKIEFFRKWYHSRAITKIFLYGDEKDWETDAILEVWDAVLHP